ncbi:hypothetical protein [Bacillus cereus]|uniref:hypothetical protein n=1 Tax=Bacillus cereus TaxID=1396 RepID=UPI000B4AA20D|nr:hypothetical protein [Bacillus cereus]
MYFLNALAEFISKEKKEDFQSYIGHLEAIKQNYSDFEQLEVMTHETLNADGLVYMEMKEINSIENDEEIEIDFIDKNGRKMTQLSWKIILSSIGEWNGYCKCNASMEGYNEKKECCGNCDWYRPTYTLQKIIASYKEFKGNQKDIWDTEKCWEKYYKKYQRMRLTSEKGQLMEQIESYENSILKNEEKIREINKEISELTSKG